MYTKKSKLSTIEVGKFVVHVEVLYNLYHDDLTGLIQLI